MPHEPVETLQIGNIAKIRAELEKRVAATEGPSFVERIEEVTQAVVPSRVSPEMRQFAERKRKQVNRRKFEMAVALGGNFNEEGELDDQGLLFDMARSFTFEMKEMKFKQSFPEGQLAEVGLASGEIALVFRKTPDAPFQEVNLPGPSAANIGDIGGLVVSEPTVLGTAGSLFGPLGTAVGTGAGVILQDVIENLRGFSENEPLDTAFRGAIGGGFAGALDALTRGVGRFLTNAVKRRAGAPFDLADGSEQAIAAAKDIGIDPFAMGQLARNPTVRAMYFQAGGTSPIPAEKVIRQKVGVGEALRGAAAREAVEQTPSTALSLSIREAEKEIDRLIPGLKFRTAGGAGAVIQKKLATIFKDMKTKRDVRYDKAFELSDDAAYDLTATQAVVKEVRQPTLTKTVEGGVTEIPRTLDPRLEEILDTLQKMDPTVKGFTSEIKGETITFNPFKQVKELRTKLFNIEGSATDAGVTRDAFLVRKALTDAMENPLSGSKEFLTAHRRASVFHRFIETQREKTVIIDALRKDPKSFDKIIERYTQPGNYTSLLTLKRMLTPSGFQTVRDRFKSHLLEQSETPGGIDRIFSSFKKDRGSLALLLTENEYKAFLTFGRRKTDMLSSVSYKIMVRNLEGDRALGLLVKKGTAKDIESFAVNPGTREAEDIRAALYTRILEKSKTVNDTGIEILDMAKVRQEISKIRDSKRFNSIMSSQDWKFVKNIETVAAVIGQKGADVGGLMQRGSVVAALKDPTRPGKFVHGARTFFGNALTARILAIPAAAKVARESFEAGTSASKFHLMFIAASIAAQQKFIE